jgi:hypothetical protein
LVQRFPSLQSTAAPGWQVPLPLHVSAMVHMLPSLHIVPADTGSPLVHPVAGSHPPWKHTGGGGQLSGAPGWQLPPAQVSFTVHMLLSLHATPFMGDPAMHMPLAGSQTPSARQTLLDGQLMVVPATQTPAPSQ